MKVILLTFVLALAMGCVAPAPLPTANPSPTTASSFDLHGDTPTEIPAVVPEQLLRIAEVSPDLPSYDRDDWKHWVDEDKDCQNMRHEILIEESSAKVAFKTDRKCQGGVVRPLHWGDRH